MKTTSRTILVTGGATGIGFALAERFAKAKNKVIVCGRREDALRAAREKIPGLVTIKCDVARETDRVALAERIAKEHPELDVLVNNAGIQRRARFAEDVASWSERQSEIAINFEAPVHLVSLFLPQLRKKNPATIVNVSSGLAFIPATFAPVYCATKAALHSFTMSLRASLSPAIEIVELIPPMVDTDLGGAGLHTHGVPLAEFADAMMAGLEKDEVEIGYGFSEKARHATRAEIDVIAARLNT